MDWEADRGSRASLTRAVLRLQAAFYAYLDSKGVDPDLCETINAYAAHKEAMEYAQWLESIGRFLEKNDDDAP